MNLKPAAKSAPKQASVATKSKAKLAVDSGLVEFEVPIIDDFVEPEVELTDADLNDPDLLRELHLVGGGVRTTVLESDTSLPLEQQLKCTQPEMVHKYIDLAKLKAINAKTSGDMFGATEANRAIAALERRYDELVNESSPPLPQTQPSESISDNVEVVADVEQDEDAILRELSDTSSLPTSVPVSSHTLQELKRRQIEYKQAALAFKSRGDTQKAREMLIVSKSMQETIDLAEAGGIIPATFKLPSIPPTPPPAAAAAAPPVAKAAPAPTTPVKRPPATISPKQAATPTLSQTSAYATPSTSLRQLPLGQQQPTTPSLATAASFTPSLTANTKPLLLQLRDQLQNQIESCTQVAHHLLKSNQKPQAVEYHKRKKLYQSDLQVLETLITASDGPAGSISVFPSFKYEVVCYEVEKSCPELGPEELEVSVVRGFDLTPPKGSGVLSNDLETYVAFDIGWPLEESGKAADGRGQSGAISKNMCPEYGYAKKVRIDRTVRAFHRHLERKRAVFDVYHQAKGWGGISLFSKPVHIGRASIGLNSLLTKVEIHEVVDLVDGTNPRKVVGGKLEVKLRVRVPILKPEIIVKEERWVVIDFSGQTAALQPPPPAQPQQQHQPQHQHTPQQDLPRPSTPASTPQFVEASAVPARASTPVGVPTTAGVSSVAGSTRGTASSRGASPVPSQTSTKKAMDIEQVEFEFLNPDAIASSEVLYHELESLTAQIASHKKPVPEELLDKKMGYELRMSVLGAMVESKQLTITKYLETVKESIVATKKIALVFKSNGKIELARQALLRVKMMTDEVTETEAAIASGQLEA
ncbi:hypothetical protein BDR26DRAFT_858272 [Obelidium mucronatum]|nr:hypothetical protein BDR26DRAFT_858272 [Obelidium mucronatum]